MLKVTGNKIAGWMGYTHIQALSPAIPFEIIETVTSPIKDCQRGECDTFALAMYAKIASAGFMVDCSMLGGDILNKCLDMQDYMVSLAETAMDTLINVFQQKYDRHNNVKEITSPGELVEIAKKIEETGEDFFVKYKGVWYYGTWVKAWGSNGLASVYGPMPEFEHERFNVFVPMNVGYDASNLPFTRSLYEDDDIGAPGTKPRDRPIIPFWPPFNMPMLDGSASFSSISCNGSTCSGDWRAEVDRLFNGMRKVYPSFYFYHHPYQPTIYTTVSVGCKYIPKATLWLRAAEAVCSKYADQLVKCPAYLEFARKVVESCKSKNSLAIASSSYLTTYMSAASALINGPLINALMWHFMYLQRKKGKRDVDKILNDLMVPYLGSITTDMLDEYERMNIPIYNILNMHYAGRIPPIPASISVYDWTEQPRAHKMYLNIALLPNYALAGKTGIKDMPTKQGFDFPIPFTPIVVTFGRDNVHPGTAYFVTPLGDGYEVFLPPLSEKDVARIAEYIYCERVEISSDKAVCTPPPGLDDVDFDLSKFPADRYFTAMEKNFFRIITDAIRFRGDGDEYAGWERISTLLSSMMSFKATAERIADGTLKALPGALEPSAYIERQIRK